MKIRVLLLLLVLVFCTSCVKNACSRGHACSPDCEYACRHESYYVDSVKEVYIGFINVGKVKPSLNRVMRDVYKKVWVGHCQTCPISKKITYGARYEKGGKTTYNGCEDYCPKVGDIVKVGFWTGVTYQ